MPPPERYNSGYNVGVGGAVVDEGRLLMVRRASRRGRGNWQVPGGFIEPEQLLHAIAPGLSLFPGGGGGVDATLSNAAAERRALLRRVSGLYESFTTVVVDGGSRLDSVMAACSVGAERLVCVTASDRISLAASYAMLKIARARFQTLPVELIVNGVDERKGRNLHAIVRTATQTFLGTDVRFGGAIPRDDQLEATLQAGVSLVQLDGFSPAPVAAEGVVSRVLSERAAGDGQPNPAISLFPEL